jgi:hypothetical protein
MFFVERVELTCVVSQYSSYYSAAAVRVLLLKEVAKSYMCPTTVAVASTVCSNLTHMHTKICSLSASIAHRRSCLNCCVLILYT